MSFPALDLASLIKAILVHVLVVALLFFNWPDSAEVIELKPLPQHVTAVVVEKPKPDKPKAAPKPAPKPAVKPKPKPKPQEKPKPKPVPKPTPKPKPKPAPAPKPAAKPAESPKPSSAFSDLLKQEMEALKDDEVEPVQGVTGSETAQQLDEILQYKAIIQQTMKRYWARPPSARNDMVVTLDISLLPGGEVKNVTIAKSSGSGAFDSSAVQAVQRAGRFSVPPDPILFDRHFRNFKMRFKPGDLRF
ncbi:cell envelope integrity protein TolA [Ketobacter alkanivorans]|nr:cell envelope integrity protein TolA [Ketobacter alkanivorans]MCP5013968.1 cell envelope integrity protein TolA [Ketobacter sp.]